MRHRWLVITVGAILAVCCWRRSPPCATRSSRARRGRARIDRSVISTNGKIEPPRISKPRPNSTRPPPLVKEGDIFRKNRPASARRHRVRSQARRAAELKGAQAGCAEHRTWRIAGRSSTPAAQSSARTDRDTAQRNLDAYKRLQEKGAASAGEVKEAENALQRAQADFDLLTQKQKERYSKPEVEHVTAQQSDAQAAYSAAEDILHKSNITSPFDGVVYVLPVKQGAYVQAGDLLLQVADLSKVLVRAYVDEPDIGRLVPGQKTEVTWDAMPGRIWDGTVTNLPSTVKLRGTRNVGEMVSQLDNHDFKLLPNTNVNVTIVMAQHDNVLVIPREALRLDDSKPYVYQIVDNKLHKQNVAVATSNLTKVEVSQGLTDKSQIALNTTAVNKSLRDGIPVKVVQ